MIHCIVQRYHGCPLSCPSNFTPPTSPISCCCNLQTMRLCIVFILTVFMYLFCVDYSCTTPYPSSPIEQNVSQKNGNLKHHDLKILNVIQIVAFGLCLLTWLCLMLLNLCNYVTYVRFDTNLTLYRKKGGSSPCQVTIHTYH